MWKIIYCLAFLNEQETHCWASHRAGVLANWRVRRNTTATASHAADAIICAPYTSISVVKLNAACHLRAEGRGMRTS